MNDFHSTHDSNTLISTQTNKVSNETMCIYIHTYTQKRIKDARKRTDRKNIVIYDLDFFESLEELAARERTNVSSIINNLYEDFITKVDNSQKSLESFQFEKQIPSLDASSETWRAFLKSLTYEEYKQFDSKLSTIMHLHNMRWKELK